MKKLITLVLAVCMLLAATTAFAAQVNGNFTPSVAAKSAPGALKAWIEDENGNIVKVLIIDEEIKLTSVADAATIANADVYNNLMASYEAILGANTLADLGLVGVDTMIVRDLFAVALVDYTIPADHVLRIIFDCDAPHALAVNGENGWLLGVDAIEENADDTITITLLETGSVAFLVDTLAQGAVTSPAT